MSTSTVSTDLKFWFQSVHFQVFILFSTLLLRIYQFREIPYGSPDDTFMASQAYSDNSLLSSAINQGQSQGRFYQVLFMFLTMSPYRVLEVRFLWILIAFQIIFFIFSLYWFTSKLWNDFRVGLIVSTLFLLFYDFRGGYNSLTSFPMWFSFAFSVYLISMGMLIESSRSLGKKAQVMHAVSWGLCFFSTIAYEAYLFFPLLFLALKFRINSTEWTTSAKSVFGVVSRACKLNKKSIYSVAIFYSSYLLCYLIFRLYFPSTYSGTQFSADKLDAALISLFKLTFAGIGSFYETLFVLSLNELVSLCISSIPHLVFFLLAITFTLTSAIRSKVGGIPAWFLMLCAFLPNALLAITKRYQEISQVAPLYLGGLLSSVSLIILCFKVVKKLLDFNSVVRVIALLILVPIFSIVSLVNNSDVTYYSDNRRSQNVAWTFAEALIDDPDFIHARITNVVSPDLIELIQTHVTYLYWDHYFSRKLNKEFIFHDSTANMNTKKYIKIDVLNARGNYAFVVRSADKYKREELKFVFLHFKERSQTYDIDLPPGFVFGEKSQHKFIKIEPRGIISQNEIDFELNQILSSEGE